MENTERQLFVGIKITKALQLELDSPAPGTVQYLEAADDPDYLEVISLGEDKFIGRYLQNGYPVHGMADVSRKICSILKQITRGRRIEENEVRIHPF